MKHELIMESWRSYISEIGMSDVGIGSYSANSDPGFKKTEAAAVIKVAKELALIFEPTGQIADVDTDTGKITTTYEVASKSTQSAIDAYEKGDFALAGTSSAIAVLNILAMIPLIGKSAKFASKSILNTNKVVATLKKSKDPKLLKKADEIENLPWRVMGEHPRNLARYIKKYEIIGPGEGLKPVRMTRPSKAGVKKAIRRALDDLGGTSESYHHFLWKMLAGDKPLTKNYAVPEKAGTAFSGFAFEIKNMGTFDAPELTARLIAPSNQASNFAARHYPFDYYKKK